MPSDYSDNIDELCRHESWRVGCLSCKLHHTKRQCAESQAKLERVTEFVKALKSDTRTDLSEDERERLAEELEECLAHQESLQNLVQGLTDAVHIVAQKVQKICAENEPDMLFDAFEKDAARSEQEMKDRWGSNWPKFKTEDPSRKSSFKGLDRTKIPATPDYLINNPIGLEIFLRLAKHRTPSHPMSVVGLSPGPAFMSYGSAVAKYGPPESPGEDWPSEGQINENLNTFNAASEISTPSDSEIATEQSTLPDSSWTLFKEDGFLNHTALLVAQYAKLVREKISSSDNDEPHSS